MECPVVVSQRPGQHKLALSFYASAEPGFILVASVQSAPRDESKSIRSLAPDVFSLCRRIYSLDLPRIRYRSPSDLTHAHGMQYQSKRPRTVRTGWPFSFKQWRCVITHLYLLPTPPGISDACSSRSWTSLLIVRSALNLNMSTWR